MPAPNVACDVCGVGLYRRPSHLRRASVFYCGRTCKAEGMPPPRLRGARNPRWKGGRITRTNHRGMPYVFVRAPAWALEMARGDGYIAQHRLVVALACGRLLYRSEVVHHIDHNVEHNALENLELWPSQRDHKLVECGRFPLGVFNLLYDPELHTAIDLSITPDADHENLFT